MSKLKPVPAGDLPISDSRPRVILLNPNSNVMATAAMVESASQACPGLLVEGVSAINGPSLVTDEKSLNEAREWTISTTHLALGGQLPPQGVIVSAFGDPGLDDLIALSIPAVGIGAEGIRTAAAIGRFAVVTTVPAVAEYVDLYVKKHKLISRYVGLFASDEISPTNLMQRPDDLEALLFTLALAAQDRGAEAIVIGGGPLAYYGMKSQSRLTARLVDPVAAACLTLQTKLLPF